ncbi:MAG: hypothetical protein LBL39_07140 [Planctomycetaceae bacterium]|nr:hypothetical protein [Planctomycetaceae bacterium]
MSKLSEDDITTVAVFYLTGTKSGIVLSGYSDQIKIKNLGDVNYATNFFSVDGFLFLFRLGNGGGAEDDI